jgi:predicted glycosyl hydrolase (DUF1957 family)
MAEKKITKREVINTMLADERVASNEVYVAYLKHELELLDKKAEKKTDSKKSVENEGYKTVIKETLATVGIATVTDLQKASAELGELSNQKVSAILQQLVKAGEVVKSTENRKSMFTLA